MISKKKIINDPVHGFIDIPAGLVYDLLSHPYLQRLRDIKQAGLSYLVYPGARHSRLSHALGAMHLMHQAVEALRSKGHDITNKEAEAAACAILLHDIGHGPFSHTLESSIVHHIPHEEISIAFMKRLNTQFNGQLDTAIAIFENKYPKKFLHQLISGQLDVDRLDYLRRDSFFSGVAEGMIGVERIIKMLEVAGDRLVVESKGIYSVEKFLISRRLMYWQVYLHKTVIAADQVLLQILRRVRQLMQNGADLFASPALAFFLKNDVSIEEFETKNALDIFARLDDSDITCAIKVWNSCDDNILQNLCRMLTARRLFKIEVRDTPFHTSEVEQKKTEIQQQLSLTAEETDYFVQSDYISNKAYDSGDEKIYIRYGKGELRDIYEASDMLGAQAFSGITKKYFLCYPHPGSNESLFNTKNPTSAI